jgi:hypothetical protein
MMIHVIEAAIIEYIENPKILVMLGVFICVFHLNLVDYFSLMILFVILYNLLY